MNHIKIGVNAHGNGMVLTDMPIEALVALREAVDDAIRNAKKAEAEKYASAISEAINAAWDAGYAVFNGDVEVDDEIECFEDTDEED